MKIVRVFYKTLTKKYYIVMNIEINVPTSLNEITLGQYQKFLKVAQENQECSFLNAKMIEIFCGIPLRTSDIVLK